MLWTPEKIYRDDPFELESDLEAAIAEVAPALFGDTRIYVDTKRKIGVRGRTRNIPDGYLVDLSSSREPKLYVVENELAKHEPLRHIAVQILEFSLSFEATPHVVKDIVKEALRADSNGLAKCQRYAEVHGFENVDYLLERMVFGQNKFNALVIIDELDPELETVLISRFKFPVEILTLERHVGPAGERIYRFDPFLSDVAADATPTTVSPEVAAQPLDPSDIDTIVVPARDDGFNDTFMGENRWYKIRIHASMIPKIKNIAVYRVAPESAITHIAPVASIEQWPETNKYVVNFAEPAQPIGPIKVLANGRIKAPQASRYTSRARLIQATSLDDAF